MCCCGGGGSVPGSSGSYIPLFTCCEDVRGDWPDNFPTNLFLTLSGSCCPDLNRTYTMSQLGSVDPFYFVNYSISNVVCSNFSISGQLQVVCADSAWRLYDFGQAHVLAELILLSCDPLHLVATGADVTHFGPDCGGTVDIEVTE